MKVPSFTSRFSKVVASLRIRVALLPSLFFPLKELTTSWYVMANYGSKRTLGPKAKPLVFSVSLSISTPAYSRTLLVQLKKLYSASAAPKDGMPFSMQAAASLTLFLAGEKTNHGSYIVKPTSPADVRSFG